MNKGLTIKKGVLVSQVALLLVTSLPMTQVQAQSKNFEELKTEVAVKVTDESVESVRLGLLNQATSIIESKQQKTERLQQEIDDFVKGLDDDTKEWVNKGFKQVGDIGHQDYLNQVFSKQGSEQLIIYLDTEGFVSTDGLNDLLTTTSEDVYLVGSTIQPALKQITDDFKDYHYINIDTTGITEDNLVGFVGALVNALYTEYDAKDEFVVGNIELKSAGALASHVALYRDLVEQTFNTPMISGYRPGDPQDHGTGHALDFGVPISSEIGDIVAQYSIENMDKYNISYVIWKQHIYGDWNKTWVPMEDRGSITQNHYDHVHVSFHK